MFAIDPATTAQIAVEQVCGYILDGPTVGRRRGGLLISGQLVKQSKRITALRAEQHADVRRRHRPNVHTHSFPCTARITSTSPPTIRRCFGRSGGTLIGPTALPAA